jgi:hypothetical protein
VRFSRPVRLPLEIGATAAWNLARGTMALPPALLFFPLFLFIPELGWLTPFVITIGAALAMVFMYQGASDLRAAQDSWPSDVVLDSDGLRIEGGDRFPSSASWADIVPGGCRLIEEKADHEPSLLRTLGRMLYLFVYAFALPLRLFLPEPRELLTETDAKVYRLELSLTSGKKVDLATAERAIERDSLQALLDTIGAATGAPAIPPRERSVAVLACEGCGATLVPADLAEVACGSCGRRARVPDELRARIRGFDVVTSRRARSEALLARLLQQPGAARAGSRLKMAGWAMAAIWLVVLGVGIAFKVMSRLTAPAVGGLVAFAILWIVALFLLARGSLADRHALRLLAIGLGARPMGDGYACRSCGAPLATWADRLVADCVYCGSDNVLGIDLRRDVAPAARQVATLEEALQARSRERALAWMAWALGLIVLAGAGALLVRIARS